MLSEPKFYEKKTGRVYFISSVDGTYFTLEELKEKITATQTDKTEN
jgi:molecular chaperone HtpG